MGGEEAFFFFFIDLERPKSFAYLPRMGSKSSSSLLKSE